jgi:uncharacterized HhH-GPD family protein
MRLAGDPAADALLETDSFALLVGMLLDQQQPMERAFIGPYRICERLGWQRLDPRDVVALGEERLTEVMKQTPAVHRFPGSMATRVVALSQAVVDDYHGDPENIWRSGTAATVLGRLQGLPGFGEAKAKIFLALLGKQRGVRPRGWREASAPYGEQGTTLSAADVVDETSLLAVRATKRELKART